MGDADAANDDAKRNEGVKLNKRPPTYCPREGCGKRVLPTDMPCRCKVRFCTAHRHPESHDCSYDFRGKHLESVGAIADRMRCDSAKLQTI